MTLKLGKLAPRQDSRTLLLSAYLAPTLPPPPASLDYSSRVRTWPMYGNDEYGDCTIAAAAHMVELWSALAGKPKVPTLPSVVNRYFKLSGGQDTGLVELDVLNDWRKDPLDRDTILAFAAVNKSNHDHVRQALVLFGGVYIGFEVPANAQTLFEEGKPWDANGGAIEGGHAVNVVGYDAAGLTVVTWGRTQRATWAWWDEYVDEAWAILPPEFKTHPPVGFNLAALEADLVALK